MEAPRAPSTLGDLDLHLLGEGTHLRAYEKLGAHLRTVDGAPGVSFAVWAPNAKAVSVVGDFNGWDGRAHPLAQAGPNGFWEAFVPGLVPGMLYKFELHGPNGQLLPLKADPRARPPSSTACPPMTGVMAPGWSPAGRPRPTRHRSASTNCTWAPGGGGPTAPS